MKRLKNRQIYILERMFAKGYITAEELEKAKTKKWNFPKNSAIFARRICYVYKIVLS